jgi:uroporphyrinogen decarboxylase
MALGFFPQSLAGMPDADEHYHTDVRYVDFKPPPDQEGFLRYLNQLPPDVHVGNQAQLRTYHEWNYHPEQGPARPLAHVRSLAELAEAVLPDLTHPSRHAGLADQVRRWHARGLAVAGSPPHLGGELFETAWRLRGFDNFMVDLLKHPELVDYLLDQLTSMMVPNAQVLARAGVDVLLLDDDVAMPTGLMISPLLWRRFFKPRLARVIALAREACPDLLVFYHSDGDFTHLVPELIDVGVDVINPVQPDCMDAVAIKRAFGDRLALWGTVGTARLWDLGTPDQVRAEVQVRMETLGPGGLLLAPAYDVDFAPRENLEAFVDEVRRS